MTDICQFIANFALVSIIYGKGITEKNSHCMDIAA